MSGAASPAPRRRLIVFLPLLVFLGLAGLFLYRLGAGDASRIPSALIGRPAPTFQLPALEGANVPALDDADLKQGRVSVVNVFASWCIPCHEEHPFLMALAENPALKDVQIVGLAYKDEPENTRRFLGARGNPFSRIGVDRNGKAGIDWGVYGVPETFVVRGDGTIAYKFIGPLNAASLRDVLLPQIEKAGSAPQK